jgi:hypothetical protein
MRNMEFQFWGNWGTYANKLKSQLLNYILGVLMRVVT